MFATSVLKKRIENKVVVSREIKLFEWEARKVPTIGRSRIIARILKGGSHPNLVLWWSLNYQS